MKYTNTNYIVVGLLIGKVTGRPAADEITWRIIVPLGLFDTYFPAPGDNGLRRRSRTATSWSTAVAPTSPTSTRPPQARQAR